LVFYFGEKKHGYLPLNLMILWFIEWNRYFEGLNRETSFRDYMY